MRRIRVAQIALFSLAAAGCGKVNEKAIDGGAGELTIVTTSLPDANRELSYETALEAAGGVPPYRWLGANLPPGLSLGSDGVISGVPTDPGAYQVSVTVTDDAGDSEGATLTLTVTNEPTITTEELPALHVFVKYAADLEALSGTPPYTFTAAGLPDGLVLDSSTGEIRSDPGSPAITDATPAQLTITVADDAGGSDSATLTLDIVGLDAVAAGGFHTCAVDAGGAAWCWGRNASGQLGNDDVGKDGPVPAPVAGEHRFSGIAAGDFHTCAIDTDGAAWCWGKNDNGQLGDDDPGSDSPVPVQVAGDHVFTTLAAGYRHTCAIDGGGAAWCWGENTGGKLGNSDAGDESPVPVPVSGNHSFTAITTGNGHTCAVDGDGVAWCWGTNGSGQLGEPEAGTSSPVPVEVSGSHTFKAIAAGTTHTCALDDGKAAWCWGGNRFGELGNNDPENGSDVPDPVSGGHTFDRVAAGAFHTCAVDTSGAAWCWGANYGGQLGNDDFENDSPVPAPVAGDHTVTTLSAGGNHACAVDDTNTAWCWGANDQGSLGNDDPDNVSPVPVPVHPGEG